MAKNEYRQGNKFYISDLRVLVYVIGYGCYGESTVILIMNGDEVYYSIVIDSYQYKPYEGETSNPPFDVGKRTESCGITIILSSLAGVYCTPTIIQSGLTQAASFSDVCLHTCDSSQISL